MDDVRRVPRLSPEAKTWAGTGALKDGPARFFPDGRVKFEDNGGRVGAELCIVQWQKGRPTAVHPESIAASKAIWPKS